MTIEYYKNRIAKEKGYPDWESMENWIIDHNKPASIAILIKAAIEDAYTRYIKEQNNNGKKG